MKILVLFCVVCLVAPSWAATGKNWALLVAGSNTFDNYRHQSDVCHAYQILKAHGIPDERIVVMMYDDIADNRRNPDKGKIINKVGGPNVYTGVPKDYTKKEVTPEIFLKVLQGEETGKGSGKVIKSGPDDHIFVNLVDHGAPGIFAFPEHVLHVKELNTALKSMHTKKQFAQMVIYMESCESGSMFYEDLPKNINIYATTAANERESSYACYYDQHLGTYLGDVYSVKWMEDSDKEDLSVATLAKQYTLVKKETNTSHVMKYGDMTFETEVLDEFQGSGNRTGYVFDSSPAVPITDAVPSEDVPLHILERKIEATDRYSNEDILTFIEKRDALLLRRKRNIRVIETIAAMSGSNRFNAKKYFMTSRLHLSQHECYQTAVDEFNKICFAGQLTKEPFAMRQMYVLINMCQDLVPLVNMVNAMQLACLD